MKKSIIALAVIAASGQALAIATADKLSGIPHKPKQPKLAENDDALWLKPIVTREMLAGTQKMLDTGYTKQRTTAKPVAVRRPHFTGEKPPVHIMATPPSTQHARSAHAAALA